MKSLLLGLVLMVGIATGIFIVGASGYGPIAYISYHIIVNNNNNNGNVTIIPAYINLGNLTPGMNGTYVANATINLSNNGTFVIQMLHEEKLHKVFSVFNVTIKIDNKTILLSLNNDKEYINLTAGKYVVEIKITYVVSQHPKGDLNVNNEPLLIIHPAGHSDDEH